jgi:hypothetical protein
MAIEVLFRGPVLYLTRDDRAEGTLLPDAERVIADDKGNEGHHADGTPAKPHYAGLVIYSDKGHRTEVFRADLRKKIVTLVTDTNPTCQLAAEFGQIVPLDDMANAEMGAPMTLLSTGDTDYWTRVSTRVVFRGGRLSPGLPSEALFEVAKLTAFQKPQPIPLAATWSSESTTAFIQTCNPDGSGFQQLRLDDGASAFVYNWDERIPNASDLTTLPKCVAGITAFEDSDVKWLYQLFNPPARDFTTWLGSGNPLPTPTTKCEEVTARGNRPGAPSPGSSGCASLRATAP